jgi:hypothetical protein
MALDLTTFAPALKQYYRRDFMENLVYKNNPLLAMMPKYEDFYGANMPIPIIFGNPQSRSATFANAQLSTENSKLRAFTLTRARDYGTAYIDNETLEASANDAGAFMKAATVEIDGAIQSVTRSIATKMYRSQSGTIARLGNSSFATAVATLASPQDVVNFEVGMRIQFSSAGTVASLRASGATLTVTAVNRANGEVTFGANLSTIGSIAQNDFMNILGDLEASIAGLESWIPATVSATPFFGVDRTVDATRLGGVRYDGSLQPIEEALVDGLSLVEREGGAPTHGFMSFANLSNLKKALGTKVQYIKEDVAGLSFSGVEIYGNKNPVKIFGDQNCPAGVAYLLQLDTWGMYSLGMAPKILDTDGLKMLRQGNADGVELRVGVYGNIATKAPGWNVRVALAS